MKFLYPIKKLNIKPWIKYWLLKNLKESTLKAVTISSGTLTKVDKSKALRIKEYYGNAIQNGTPTPDSPVEIQTISGDNTFTINSNSYRVDLGGKNNFYDTLRQGVTAYNTGVWGSSNTRITSTDWIQNVKAGTYTISAKTSTTKTLQVSMVTFNTIGVFNDIPNVSGQWKTMPFTFTIPIDMNLKCNIKYSNETAITPSEVTEVQLESGSIATPYSPYTANPIELCKIGDYQDKLYYDSGNSGKWYLLKNISKVVLNGSENWYFTSNCCYTNNIVDTVKRPPNNNTKANIICDHYQIDTLANCYNNVTDKRISVNNGGYVYIYDTSFTSANDIKTWLTTHNVSLYYALATPTTETITNTNLISELNALYEFYVNSSKVTISNNSEIPFEFLLEYYGR